MDPLEVIRRIWKQRWFTLPALLIAVVAAVLVFFYGPREYQASSSYAIVNPQVPTAAQIEADPALGELNSNNPYLRSSDPSLVGDAVITRLNAPEVQDSLKAQGLGTTYTVGPDSSGTGSIVAITGNGSTARQAIATTEELGTLLKQTLRSIQTVNGADDRYLFTSLQIVAPAKATEQLSSRLRTVIVVAVCGVVLIFAAVSLGTWRDAIRRRRTAPETEDAATSLQESPASPPSRPIAASRPALGKSTSLRKPGVRS